MLKLIEKRKIKKMNTYQTQAFYSQQPTYDRVISSLIKFMFRCRHDESRLRWFPNILLIIGFRSQEEFGWWGVLKLKWRMKRGAAVRDI